MRRPHLPISMMVNILWHYTTNEGSSVQRGELKEQK